LNAERAVACLLVVVVAWRQPDGPSVAVADAGNTVQVDVGESFDIVLASNPTRGYRWEAVGLDGELLAMDDSAHDPESDLLGAGGAETLTFRALRAGETTLTPVNHRPWEDAAPLETVTYRIIMM